MLFAGIPLEMDGNLNSYARVIIGGVVIAFAWHFGKELCSMFARKVWNKLDADYLTLQEFTRICHDNRNNCIVVRQFNESMDGMKKALRILIVHTVNDKETQEEALKELG